MTLDMFILGDQVTRLGHGETNNRGGSSTNEIPHKIKALKKKKCISVACGWCHTVVLTDDGQVYTFGGGWLGLLGHGDEVTRTSPKLVERLLKHKIVYINTGWNMTLAIDGKHYEFLPYEFQF
eukprot:TRINITY_DN2381_c0_g1_i2.p1 TRINITY_DN2381_c0_g1~~TRINITY_DN2381_c0_g1_i2.p1  ORF type:complete len:123 (-),score=12.84 TRINITY_DN2381_c0_g1_i2:206-574(-)